MSLTETVDGTLKADGTLELDQMPSLSAGRVKVTLQAIHGGSSRKRGLTDVIDEIHNDQHSRGYAGRTTAEMTADETARETEQNEYDQRMEKLLRWPRANPTGDLSTTQLRSVTKL